MCTTMEERQQFVSHLGDYLVKTKNLMEEFTRKLGWDQAALQQECKLSKVACPFNAGHIVPATSLEKHKEVCAWKQEGYSREEMEMALPSSHFFYQNSTSVVPILIDKNLQAKIFADAAARQDSNVVAPPVDKNVPRTMDRAMSEFTSAQRLAIYEYVIEKTKLINKTAIKVEDLQFNVDSRKDSNESKPKSHLEIMAEQRDYKRRRQSYRAKNVHITKKSYSEVMREVIQNQMEFIQGGPEMDDADLESTVNCKSLEEDVKKERSPTPFPTDDQRNNGNHSSSSKHSRSRDKRFNDDDVEDPRESHRKRFKRDRSDDRDRSYKHHRHHKHKKSKHRHRRDED